MTYFQTKKNECVRGRGESKINLLPLILKEIWKKFMPLNDRYYFLSEISKSIDIKII